MPLWANRGGKPEDLFAEQEVMNEPEIVAAVRPVLDAFKKLRIPYYIGGSVASSIYGVARTTMDVDAVADLRPEHARALLRRPK